MLAMSERVGGAGKAHPIVFLILLLPLGIANGYVVVTLGYLLSHAGVSIGAMEVIPVVAAMFLISFTLTGLGFLIAWRMDSTAAFHGVMMLLLVPMWMVSGALFPMATAHGWVKAIMWVNPLTYSIALLNHTLRLPSASPGPLASLLVTAGFGLALLFGSGILAAQKSTRSAA